MPFLPLCPSPTDASCPEFAGPQYLGSEGTWTTMWDKRLNGRMTAWRQLSTGATCPKPDAGGRFSRTRD